MAAATMDIALRRNEDWLRQFEFLDDEGEPISLSGHTIEMKIREQLTNVLIATAEVTVTDAAAGQFEVLIEGTGDLVDYGNSLRTYEFPYDLRITDPAGVRTDVVAGKVIISRGIT